MYRCIIFTKLFPEAFLNCLGKPSSSTVYREWNTLGEAMSLAVKILLDPSKTPAITYQLATGLVFVNHVACGVVFKVQ